MQVYISLPDTPRRLYCQVRGLAAQAQPSLAMLAMRGAAQRTAAVGPAVPCLPSTEQLNFSPAKH